MNHKPLIPVLWSALLVAALLALAACAAPSAAPTGLADTATPTTTTTPRTTAKMTPLPTDTPRPTRTPSPTPEPTFPPDTRVADVAIGDMNAQQAEQLLLRKLPALAEPLVLHTEQMSVTIAPDDIDLELALDEMLAQASQPQRPSSPISETDSLSLSLQVRFDQHKVERYLDDLTSQTILSPTMTLVVDETDPISRSFAYRPARLLDTAQAMQQIEQHLTDPQASRAITIALQDDPDTPVPRATIAQVQEQVEAMADYWDGVVGFYLYDLASSETAAMNENTVFSGASIMKVAILLNSYLALPELSEKQQTWVELMITESDNHSANHMLAAIGGGTGTDKALEGAHAMSDMLQSLGLEHTYQYMPYEAHDYLVNIRGVDIKHGPAQEGSPPYTDADPVLRTTPAEMSRLFLMIDQCSQGEGPLIETFTETITLDRCQDMLDLLARNEDNARLRRGIPDTVRVEHKSGWIADMQSDVGIVRSPGGPYILAIYLYQQTDYLYDKYAHPVIGAFSRMVYTAYNPIRETPGAEGGSP
jgi:beta-lactamase class A